MDNRPLKFSEFEKREKAVIKNIRSWGFSKKEDINSEFWLIHDKKLLNKEMKTAAQNLDFERAVKIRDLIKKLDNKKTSA